MAATGHEKHKRARAAICTERPVPLRNTAAGRLEAEVAPLAAVDEGRSKKTRGSEEEEEEEEEKEEEEEYEEVDDEEEEDKEDDKRPKKKKERKVKTKRCFPNKQQQTNKPTTAQWRRPARVKLGLA